MGLLGDHAIDRQCHILPRETPRWRIHQLKEFFEEKGRSNQNWRIFTAQNLIQ
jgi:hypothetical protein